MTTFTYAQLESLWIQAGGPATVAPVAAAIALAESGGNPLAAYPGTTVAPGQGSTTDATGLWQILGLPAGNFTAAELTDPLSNARMAVAKYQQAGNSFSPWQTFDNGSYAGLVQQGVAPSAPDLGDATGTTGGGSATPAQTTSSNTPLQWTESAIPGFGWFGGLITGATGGLTGLNSISDIATGVAGLVRSMNKGLQLALLLFRPSFWLRIGAFWVGTLALIGSAYFFGKTL